MKIKLTRPQAVTIFVMSLLVAFVLLVNFLLEFQKISSRRYITQSFPLQVSEDKHNSQAGSSLRKYTLKRTPLEQSTNVPRPRQKGKGAIASDPLKYGTISIIKEDENQEAPQEAQEQQATPQEGTQEQAVAASALAQRVQDIMPNFDSSMQEKINQAIENPRLIPHAIEYTEEEIEACSVALAKDENNLEAATKKERLMVLKSILLSTLNP